MSINNINRPQSQPLAHDVSAGSPKQGATPKGTPVEVQTPMPQTGFLSKMKAGFSSVGSSISAGFKSLSRGSAQSAPPGPARATTAAVNDQAKVAGQSKAACTFLLRSVSTPSLTGLPVVNLAMAKGALTELLDLPQATRESSLQSLVKSMSGAELSHAAEGLSQLHAALAGPAMAGGPSFKQYIASETLRDVVGQEQRSRALTPDNFGKLASMVANGNKLTASQLVALPETHPARALFSAYLGKESSVENFNFCKAMAAVEAQTDPAKQNAMLKEIAEHVKPDDLNLNTPQQEKLKTLFMMGAASQTGNYSACLPALREAAAEIATLTNSDTMRRFEAELTKDLAELAPKAHQSDLVALNGSAFPGSGGPALTTIINNTMTSNRAADPHADFFGAGNLGAPTSNRLLAALLDDTPGPAALSLGSRSSAVPVQAGARASAPREQMSHSQDPLGTNPMTAQRQWIADKGGKENVTLKDILDLPTQHPVRISLREGMTAHYQKDSFTFLETLRNEPQMDLSRARQVVDQQMGDINVDSSISNALIRTLGGTMTMVAKLDPEGGPSDYVPTITWKPADSFAAAMPEGSWARAFDAAASEITKLVSTTNFSEVLKDTYFFPVSE